jgi:hypothetical protein
MKHFVTLATALLMATGVASAARYTGRLMDASCYNEKKVDSRESGHKNYSAITKTCAATSATTDFAVRITGNKFHEDEGLTIRLNDSGNAMAASEMKSGTLKPGPDGVVRIATSGKLLGETFETKTLTARGSSAGGS